MSDTRSVVSSPVVLAVANQKGGVGKTTVAVNLGAGLALRGYRVLVLDLDLQANATQILYRAMEEGEDSVAEAILEEVPLDQVIVETSTPRLWLAPSSETMVRVDIALTSMLGREEALRRTLRDCQRAHHVDFVVIDTSPYLGLLTVNALVASRQILIPVSCEYLPMLGLKLFLSTIQTIRRRLNDELHILGFLLTMFDRRESITFEVERMMRQHFGEQVFKRPIRINTRHKASPAHRQTIFQYETPPAKGVEDFNWLVDATLERLGYPLQHDPIETESPPPPQEGEAAPTPKPTAESPTKKPPQEAATREAATREAATREAATTTSNSPETLVTPEEGSGQETTGGIVLERATPPETTPEDGAGTSLQPEKPSPSEVVNEGAPAGASPPGQEDPPKLSQPAGDPLAHEAPPPPQAEPPVSVGQEQDAPEESEPPHSPALSPEKE